MTQTRFFGRRDRVRPWFCQQVTIEIPHVAIGIDETARVQSGDQTARRAPGPSAIQVVNVHVFRGEEPSQGPSCRRTPDSLIRCAANPNQRNSDAPRRVEPIYAWNGFVHLYRPKFDPWDGSSLFPPDSAPPTILSGKTKPNKTCRNRVAISTPDYCAASLMIFSIALRPCPVSTRTVVSTFGTLPERRILSNTAPAVAVAGSTKKPRRANAVECGCDLRL